MSQTETHEQRIERLRRELQVELAEAERSRVTREQLEETERSHMAGIAQEAPLPADPPPPQQMVVELPPETAPERERLSGELDELLEQEFPPAWKPTKGEHPAELKGHVDRLDLNVGPSPAYGTYSAVMELTTFEGLRWSVWAQHGGVIFSQLQRLRVQPGDVVGVRYLGPKASAASGFTYQNYRVVKKGDQGVGAHVDYDAPLRGSPEQQQLPVGNGVVEDDIPF